MLTFHLLNRSSILHVLSTYLDSAHWLYLAIVLAIVHAQSVSILFTNCLGRLFFFVVFMYLGQCAVPL